ncbi:MAG: hypothetical protein KDM91_20660, partial [Verrucomicrobiae bacterium]|nr:hypothetical protein [Verrucomicrobiae bacterium]
MLRKTFLILALLSPAIPCRPAMADETRPSVSAYETATDIPYRTEAERRADPYIDERCRLDVYHPIKKTGFVTVVWFHGGGLTGGNRFVPRELMEKGLAV